MKKVFIKSFEQACELTGIDSGKLPDVSWMSENLGKSMIATYKMEIITKAQNKLDEFIPDYNNSSQWKYYPWLVWKASVSAFVFRCTDFTRTHTSLGSRFCFKDDKTAEHIGKTFIQIYNEMMLKD